jgi:hypothetical protein
MGMCCVGTSGEPTDQGTCLEIGGDYYDDPGQSCLSGGLCAFLSALNEYLHEQYGEDPIVLLAAGGTYTSLYDLRDEVLAKSDVG